VNISVSGSDDSHRSTFISTGGYAVVRYFYIAASYLAINGFEISQPNGSDYWAITFSRASPSKDGAGHIKKSSRVLCEGVAGRYAMTERLRLEHPAPMLCDALEVSESGYYDKQRRPMSKRAKEDVMLEVEILASHKRTRGT
jgi:hypothetical protein